MPATNPDGLLNYAIGLHESGKVIDAIKIYRQLQKQFPKHSHLLFLLGVAECQSGNEDGGIKLFNQSLKILPDAQTFYNKGKALDALGRLEESLQSYNDAIALTFGDPVSHNNKGIVLAKLNRHDEAIQSYNIAISLAPNFAQAYFNKGSSLQESNNAVEALHNYEMAIELKLRTPELFLNRGVALEGLNALDDALASYQYAITLFPDCFDAIVRSASVLYKLARYAEATRFSKIAIGINPNHLELFIGLSSALIQLKQFAEALSCCDRAIELQPDCIDAQYNRGLILLIQQRFDEALASFKKTAALNPNHDYLLGTLLHTKMQLCNWADFDELLQGIQEALNTKSRVTAPFPLLGLVDDPELHKLASKIYVEDLFAQKTKSPQPDKYQDHAKLRIGYFSADFHDHATLHLMMDVFKNHDQSRFDVYAFSFNTLETDNWYNEVKTYFKQFIDVTNMPDESIAKLCRELEIDIAIDLKGFTQDNRTGIFSFRAAPIQVNYLGYPGTMGAQYIDYIIADEFIIPNEFQRFYSEKVAYLPHCYQPNMQKRVIADNAFVRSDFGLPENGFVFCSFNNHYKITPKMFSVWMDILRNAPNSILWILQPNASASKNLQDEAKIRGIDPARIVFSPKLPIEEHLKRLILADVFLDTFPYNAHTTASDAIRMGVPIVTLLGKSFASRVASSILNALGMAELITTNINDYQNLAVDLATDHQKLHQFKSRLADSLTTSPLFDSVGFTNDLENLYLQLML